VTTEQAARRWRERRTAQARRDVELETFPTTAGAQSKVSHPMFGTGRPASPARARLPGLVTEPPGPAGLTSWGTWGPAPIEHVGGGYHLLACNLISQDGGWFDSGFYVRFAVAVWLIRPDGSISDPWVSPGNTVRPYTQGGSIDAVNAPPLGEPTEGSTPKLTRWQEGALLSFTTFTNERQYVDDLSGFWPQSATALDVPWGANVYYHIGHDGTDPVPGPPFELYAGPDGDFPTDGDWDVGGGVTEFDDGTVEGFEVIGPSADPNIAICGQAYNSSRHRVWLLDKDGAGNLTLSGRTTWPSSIPTGNPGGLTRIAKDRWIAMGSRDLSSSGMAAILFNAKTGTVVDDVSWNVGDGFVDVLFLSSFWAYYAGNHLHFDGQASFAAWWQTPDYSAYTHRHATLTVDGDVLTVADITDWDTSDVFTAERWTETCEGCLRIVTNFAWDEQALFERRRAKAALSPLGSPTVDEPSPHNQRTVPSSHPAGYMWTANVAIGLQAWDQFSPIRPKLVRYPASGATGGTGTKQIEAPTPDPSTPDAPTNLTATGGDGQVSLSWTPSTDADSHDVYRSTTDDFATATKLTTSLDGSADSYVDETADNDVTYYYWVTATNAEGESAPSTSDSATPAVPELSLNDLTDVTVTSPQNGDGLIFTAGTWENTQP